MDIKLIAIDLDGTLLQSDRTLSEENRLAIEAAKEAGVKIVLCTGRPLRSMKHLLAEANLLGDDDIAITYNGGLIQKTKSEEIIRQMTFDRSQCLDIYKLGQKLNMPINFIDLDYVYEPPYPNGVESKYIETNRYVPKEHALTFTDIDIDNLPDPFPINKIVICRPSEEIDDVIPKIPISYFEKYNIYKSQATILEILPQDIDKGYSMRVLGELLGLEKEQIMGIGDQENDLSLVENAGFGVAMDNAIDKVKEAADYITKSNDDHGVAHVINRFVLNN